jgi:hypothetical protein
MQQKEAFCMSTGIQQLGASMSEARVCRLRMTEYNIPGKQGFSPGMPSC